jgi:glucose 1-dehydrogenase
MKAVAVLPHRRLVGVVEHDAPRLTTPTQVLLRVLDVGVCGTDREICTFQYGVPPAGCRHLVLGHESLAEVLEVGPGVRHLRPGDLVVPSVRRPCHHEHCVACRGGQQDFCFTGDFQERGIGGLHGFMTERVVEEEHYLHRVPPALRDVAVLVEPLTIAEKALLQVTHVQQRLPWACALTPGAPAHGCHRAVVLGGGPVGLLGAMALVNAGFDTWVYSREEAPNPKADIVAQIGARWVSAADRTVTELAAEVGNIDLVYEATGASALAFEMLPVLGVNGIFVFTGVPGRKAPVPVDTGAIMRGLVLRNQVVLGTVNAGHDAFAAAVADLGVFAARWPRAVRALITGRHPIQRAEDLLVGPATGIKNVIQFAA